MKHSINQQKAFHTSLSLAASNCMQHSPGPTTLSFQYREVVSQCLQSLQQLLMHHIRYLFGGFDHTLFAAGAKGEPRERCRCLFASKWIVFEWSGMMFNLLNLPWKGVCLNRTGTSIVCACVILCEYVCVCFPALLSLSVSVSNEVWRRKLSQILSSVFTPSIPNQQANSIPNHRANSIQSRGEPMRTHPNGPRGITSWTKS